MPPAYSREIALDDVYNFRDLGGYAARGGRTVAWRRVFRSGLLDHASPADGHKLRHELGLAAVLDLREPGPITGAAASALSWCRYHNVPIATGNADDPGEWKVIRGSHHLGEVYAHYLGVPEYGRRLVRAVSVIAESRNHPLVFHCSAGKDRTGLVAAVVLGALGVSDEDIAFDYSLTAEAMPLHLARLRTDPEAARFLDRLPAHIHETSPHSMTFFLSALRRGYGSVRDYLVAHGADGSLFDYLEQALLV